MIKSERKFLAQSFLLAFLMALVAIGPVLIYSGGYLILYGDYNVQVIPFYKTAVEAVRTGMLRWSWESNLGANFMANFPVSSPFFWLTALFPSSMTEYVMGPMMMLKTAVSAVCAFVYIRRFVRRPESALIGSLLYAFSGYALTNIVFYNFHDTICFFPLLLVGLEEAVVCKRRGLFALTVALTSFISYFFFIGECIFLVIYFLVRMYCDKSFRINVRDFFALAFESLAGVALAGIMFVPSISYVLTIGRTSEWISSNSMFVFNEPVTYLVILKALFLPLEAFSTPYIFWGAETSWKSVAVYLPLFSIAGVVAYFKNAGKRDWVKNLIGICAVVAIVPVLNSAFTMFNANYYARWYYMPVLILCVATVKALEDMNSNWKLGCITALAGSLLFTAVYFFMPYEKKKMEGNSYDGSYVSKSLTSRLFDSALKWEELLFLIIAVGSAAAVAYLIICRRKLPVEKILEKALSMTVIAGILLGCVTMFEGRLAGPALKSYNQMMDLDVDFNDDGDFYRVNLDNHVNYTMLWGLSSAQSFNSMLPQAVIDLHTVTGSEENMVMVSRSSSDYAFNALTRTKYIMGSAFARGSGDNEGTYFDESNTALYYGDYGPLYAYRNEYILPMACSYDSYCYQADVIGLVSANTGMTDSSEIIKEVTQKEEIKDDDAPDDEKNVSANLMVHSVVLKADTIDKYSDIMYYEKLDKEQLTLGQFKKDISDRMFLAAEDFEITKEGFKVHTNYDRDRIVVFSVAYDKGWSAKINGTEVTPDCANIGFLAVRVPAGEQEIVMEYTPIGFVAGVITTIVAAVLLIIYAVIIYVVLKKRPKAYVYPTADKQIALHSGYIAETAPSETVSAETAPAETAPAETAPAETVSAESPLAESTDQSENSGEN